MPEYHRVVREGRYSRAQIKTRAFDRIFDQIEDASAKDSIEAAEPANGVRFRDVRTLTELPALVVDGAANLLPERNL